jgi:hypothetical protein
VSRRPCLLEHAVIPAAQQDVPVVAEGPLRASTSASIFSQGNRADSQAFRRPAADFSSCWVWEAETCSSTVRNAGPTTASKRRGSAYCQ